MLSSGEGALAIQSVWNVSELYAAKLDQVVKDMEENPQTRNAIIEKDGLEGWRKERFLSSLEAALFRTGHLARWKVSVRKV